MFQQWAFAILLLALDFAPFVIWHPHILDDETPYSLTYGCPGLLVWSVLLGVLLLHLAGIGVSVNRARVARRDGTEYTGWDWATCVNPTTCRKNLDLSILPVKIICRRQRSCVAVKFFNVFKNATNYNFFTSFLESFLS